MHIAIKNLSILIIMLQFVSGIGQTIINLLGQCACEELLYKFECDQLPSCKFSNDVCKSLQCNEILTQQSCAMKRNCAWYKNKCTNFNECSYYNLTTSTSCHQLNYECQYNPYKQKCTKYNNAFINTCSQTTMNQCYYGSDGICKYENNYCSKLITCESVAYTDYSCAYAEPACYANPKTKVCETQTGCKNAQRNQCWYAPMKIGDLYNVYLCQEADIEGECEDWNPKDSNKYSCFLHSQGYFHWNGYSCEICDGKASVILIANIIAFLIFGQ